MQMQQIQWQRPQFGWFKCNVDVNDSCTTSAGWFLIETMRDNLERRDHLGVNENVL
jgi:hypothetical protein